MKVFLTIFLLLILNGLSAQEGVEDFYEDFRGFQIDDHIQIDFGIIEGASCFGVQLQRRDEAGHFVVVNEIQGVCGGSEFTEYYSIRDESPNTYKENVYRLKFGLDELYSERLSITYIPNETGVVVYPNPASDVVKIRFQNIQGSRSSLRIINSDGKEVLSLQDNSTDEYELNIQGWKSGIYSFELQLAGKSFFDKIIVH